MRKVSSREYKAMLKHGAFAKGRPALETFWEEVSGLADSLRIKTKGAFNKIDKRTLVFLDTPDFTLHRNGVVFRRRKDKEDGAVEYTLKCRSEDRYVANGIDLRAAEGLKEEDKFEEDVAARFQSRFSHSNTITFSAGQEPGKPEDLDQAGRLFPFLLELKRDGGTCPGRTPLEIVNNVKAFERVYKGPKLQFEKEDATIAVILWSQGSKGRPLVAEFSFRYQDDDEKYSPAVAAAAKNFFEVFQRLDWCLPGGMTKTQYVYRGTSGATGD